MNRRIDDNIEEENNINGNFGKKFPSMWRCRKMPIIALERVKCGESEYDSTIEKLLDDGFRLQKVSKEAIPADDGFICDCGEWVSKSDYFHEVLECRIW
jgi:hypothetical protein